MLMKKTVHTAAKSGVTYINGSIKMGRVKLNVCSFVTDGVLIDTGAPNLLDTFKPFFAAHPIEQIVLTHHHEDHSGGASYLQTTYHLPVFVHEALLHEHQREAHYPLYRKLFWGKRKPFQATAIEKTFASKTATWRVIETPGHATDHISLLNEATGQLFSGDLFVHPETKVILRDESIMQIIQSIEKVLTYDFQEMYCAHAGYVADGPKALRKKLAYLKELVAKVTDLYSRGYTVQAITKQIFPKTYPITYISFGEWNATHIVRSILQDYTKQKLVDSQI